MDSSKRRNDAEILRYFLRPISCFSYVLMISLDLMKSSEVRKAGDRSNCPTFKYTNNSHTAEILAL